MIECEVSTNYKIWMNRITGERQKNEGCYEDSIYCKWPHKKVKKQTIDQSHLPRFESWEGRLLKRFSNMSGNIEMKVK